MKKSDGYANIRRVDEAFRRPVEEVKPPAPVQMYQSHATASSSHSYANLEFSAHVGFGTFV